MHEQSNDGSPKAEFHGETVHCKYAEEQHEQDARNTRRPEQDLFKNFIQRPPAIIIACLRYYASGFKNIWHFSFIEYL